MEEQIFDAVAFARFELNAGEIRSAEDGALLLLPPEVAAEIAPSPTVNKASRDWGHLHGRGLRSALEIRNEKASMELLSQHLCGTLAVLGLGRVSIEVHGNALLLRQASSSPVAQSKGLSAILCGFVAGYLEGLTDQPFAATPVGTTFESAFIFVGNDTCVAAVTRLAGTGASAVDIVKQLSHWSVA